MPVATLPVVRTPDHRYLAGDRELLGVTSILRRAGLSDFSAPHFTEWVRTRGSLAHQAIAMDIDGTLDEGSLDPVLVGYLTGWRLFVAEASPVVEFSEQVVSDLELGAAGTLDLIVQLPGARRRLLLDIKPAVYPSACVQTAAYARLAQSLYDQPVIFDRAALVLAGDGTYVLKPFTDPSDDRTFRAALIVAQWQVSHGLR